jgi:hypothetical protein
MPALKTDVPDEFTTVKLAPVSVVEVIRYARLLALLG